MTSPRLQSMIFAGLLLLLFIGVGSIFAPFFSVILWSILLYILISPPYHRLMAKVDLSNRRGKLLRYLLAGTFSIGSVVLVLVPLAFIAFQLFQQLIDLVQFITKLFNANHGLLDSWLSSLCATISDLSAGKIVFTPDEIVAQVTGALSQSMNRIVSISTSFVKDVGTFILQFAFMIFTLYFFYLDGPYLAGLVAGAIPIRGDYIKQLFAKIRDITKNLFSGYILVALFQGVMAYIIFLIFRVKGPLAFAVLTMISSFIPMLGASLVWLPIGILKIASGSLAGGILFMVVSAFFISTLDNLLRPLFLRDRIHLHPLVIFFAILGGVKVFGFNGLILGPMVVILFLTTLDLFLSEHSVASLPPASTVPSDDGPDEEP